jgi:hypothetical protein
VSKAGIAKHRQSQESKNPKLWWPALAAQPKLPKPSLVDISNDDSKEYFSCVRRKLGSKGIPTKREIKCVSLDSATKLESSAGFPWARTESKAESTGDKQPASDLRQREEKKEQLKQRQRPNEWDRGNVRVY